MVGVDSRSLYTVQADSQRKSFGLDWGRRPLGAVYIHQMNRVNSRNASAMTTAPSTLSWILILLLVLLLYTCTPIARNHKVYAYCVNNGLVL